MATGPSRRNATQPAPPSPPRTLSWHSSTNWDIVATLPVVAIGAGGRRVLPLMPDVSRICAFAPSPILTVTIETVADSDPEIHVHAGGQGF